MCGLVGLSQCSVMTKSKFPAVGSWCRRDFVTPTMKHRWREWQFFGGDGGALMVLDWHGLAVGFHVGGAEEDRCSRGWLGLDSAVCEMADWSCGGSRRHTVTRTMGVMVVLGHDGGSRCWGWQGSIWRQHAATVTRGRWSGPFGCSSCGVGCDLFGSGSRLWVAFLALLKIGSGMLWDLRAQVAGSENEIWSDTKFDAGQS